MTDYERWFAGEELLATLGKLEAARDVARKDWDARIDAELKHRFPRKRDRKFLNLDAAWVEELRASILAEHRIEELENEVRLARNERREMLNELAGGVEFVPQGELIRLQSAWISTYRSQTQPELYARGELEPVRARLDALGFCVEVRPDDYDGFVLWADCPEWMFDAITRALTMEEARDAWHRFGVNVKVYWPYDEG